MKIVKHKNAFIMGKIISRLMSRLQMAMVEPKKDCYILSFQKRAK